MFETMGNAAGNIVALKISGEITQKELENITK
jgi:hypothetical protein